MKKKLIGVLFVGCASMLVGCGNSKELKTIKCTLSKNARSIWWI